MGPRGPKMQPRWAQEVPRCSKMLQDGPKRLPRWPQEAPKMAPRGPKRRAKNLKKPLVFIGFRT